MPDFSIHQYGTDSSSRPVYLTTYMHNWWEGIVRELGFRPTIVQGAWMNRAGGGAAASAGYHDGGGCIDLRVWDLTATQQQAVIHATRAGGAGSWLRDQAHGGFDPHIHLVLGSDNGLAPGASWQWLNYLHGGDGLSGNGHDYHPRPNPLITEPPASLMEEDMQPEDFTKIRAIVAEESAKAARAAVNEILDSEQANGKSLRENIRMGGNAKEWAKAVADELGVKPVVADRKK